MRPLEKFGSDTLDKPKGDLLASRLAAADAKLHADPGFVDQIELDPAAALAELGLTGDAARTFRILPVSSPHDSCSCNCYATACGTGVGCSYTTDGHGSASSGC